MKARNITTVQKRIHQKATSEECNSLEVQCRFSNVLLPRDSTKFENAWVSTNSQKKNIFYSYSLGHRPMSYITCQTQDSGGFVCTCVFRSIYSTLLKAHILVLLISKSHNYKKS